MSRALWDTEGNPRIGFLESPTGVSVLELGSQLSGLHFRTSSNFIAFDARSMRTADEMTTVFGGANTSGLTFFEAYLVEQQRTGGLVIVSGLAGRSSPELMRRLRSMLATNTYARDGVVSVDLTRFAFVLTGTPYFVFSSVPFLSGASIRAEGSRADLNASTTFIAIDKTRLQEKFGCEATLAPESVRALPASPDASQVASPRERRRNKRTRDFSDDFAGDLGELPREARENITGPRRVPTEPRPTKPPELPKSAPITRGRPLFKKIPNRAPKFKLP